MSLDPEKPRKQSPDNSAGPIEWQSETDRNQTGNEQSNTNRDVETDQPARSDSAA